MTGIAGSDRYFEPGAGGERIPPSRERTIDFNITHLINQARGRQLLDVLSRAEIMELLAGYAFLQHSHYLSDVLDALSSVDIPFSDGDALKRVTVTNAFVKSSSKILGTVQRVQSVVDDQLVQDCGFLYIANVIRVKDGAFDLLIGAFGPALEDVTELPPNETVKFIYSVHG